MQSWHQNFSLRRHPLVIALVLLSVVYFGQICIVSVAMAQEHGPGTEGMIVAHADSDDQYDSTDEQGSVNVHQHERGAGRAVSVELATVPEQVSNFGVAPVKFFAAGTFTQAIVLSTQSPTPLRC